MSALSYASMLSKRMVRVNDEIDITDILWRPHAYEKFNEIEIKGLLELMNPWNSFVILRTKNIENEVGLDFKIEKWYDTRYAKTKFNQEFLLRIGTVLPDSTHNLGFPPENTFMPKELINKKKERSEDSNPDFPSKISE